jgi:hypothetical protein
MAENDTIPTTEAGEDWLKCLEFAGRGAKDPTGGSLPQGWHVLDLVATVKVKRGKKIKEVDVDEVKKGDLVIKAIMDETVIGDLYDGDPDAILLSDAKGRQEWTRLSWYKDFGRDGLRTWATSAVSRKIAGPGVHVG